MWPAQSAPGVPDPGALKDLNPGVAIVFLAVVALIAILFYFGGPLRDRLQKKPPDPPPPPPSQSVAAPAVTAAKDTTDRFITFLQDQIGSLEGQVQSLTREKTRLEADVADLRVQVQRARYDGGGGDRGGW